MSYNQISVITEIQQQKLTHLDLAYNKLTDLEKVKSVIFAIKTLKYLTFEGNLISQIQFLHKIFPSIV